MVAIVFCPYSAFIGYISNVFRGGRTHPTTSCPDADTDPGDLWQCMRMTEYGDILKLGCLTVIVLLPRTVNYLIGESSVDISWARPV